MMPSDPSFHVAVEAIREFLAKGDPQPSTESGFAADLTPRERAVLELIAQGLDKLQVANRSQAIVKAREAGMGTHPDRA